MTTERKGPGRHPAPGREFQLRFAARLIDCCMDPAQVFDVVRDTLAAAIRESYCADFDWRRPDHTTKRKRGRPRKLKGMTLDAACEMVVAYFVAIANQWDDDGVAEMLRFGTTDDRRREIARAIVGAGRRVMPMNATDARRAYAKYYGANPLDLQDANTLELKRQHIEVARELARVDAEREGEPDLH